MNNLQENEQVFIKKLNELAAAIKDAEQYFDMPASSKLYIQATLASLIEIYEKSVGENDLIAFSNETVTEIFKIAAESQVLRNCFIVGGFTMLASFLGDL